MTNAKQRSLETYRHRLKQRGFVRLEVHVRKQDTAIVREVVKALSDPDRQAEARALLSERFGTNKTTGLKALLASAPLEGIDLAREQDLGRDIAL